MRKVYNQKNMSLTIDGVNIQDFHEHFILAVTGR